MILDELCEEGGDDDGGVGGCGGLGGGCEGEGFEHGGVERRGGEDVEAFLRDLTA